MAKKPKLSHLAKDGSPRMVDVGAKAATRREAVVEAWVELGPVAAALVRRKGAGAKGDVLATARLAGIMAAKRTAELIPMCHPLALDVVEVEAALVGERVHIVSRAAAEGKTGVEMEALTAATVAALTVYDMCKSAGKGIRIENIVLLRKSGGKSGTWRR
jgi:cyclic pyranopterin phosphate synthase